MVDKPTVRVVINVTGLPNTYKETHSDNNDCNLGVSHITVMEVLV